MGCASGLAGSPREQARTINRTIMWPEEMRIHRPRPVKWCARLSASSSPDLYAAWAIAITSSGSSAGGESVFVDRLDAHVAAGDGPLVVLLGQDRADQADDGGAVGEDADDVGAAADLLVEPLERVVLPDLAPVLLGKAGEGEQVGGGLVEQLGRGGEALLELGDDAGVLLEDRVGVGLGEDRAHHRRDEALRALGDAGQQVAHEVRAAALPARPGRVAAIASTSPGCASSSPA